MATLIIKLAVYLVEDVVHELASQSLYRSPKMIHLYPMGIGGSPTHLTTLVSLFIFSNTHNLQKPADNQF